MPRDHDWTEGITDNQAIREALSFASRWQQREWSIATLPRDLRVGVRMGPGATSELGACVEREDGRRGIGLNELIVGTRGFVPVLAHECGHLFQPGGAVGMCRSGVQVSRREREAWWIASNYSGGRVEPHHPAGHPDVAGA